MNAILSLPGLHWLAHKQPFSLRLKRAAFDAKHRAGQWGHGEAPEVGAAVMKYARGNTLQVLGCGACDICAVIDMSALWYVRGVDLSPIAIEHARKKYGHHKNLSLAAGDMLSLAKAGATVTLFSESLYYLSTADQMAVLLKVGGIHVVTLADPVKHAAIAQMIRDAFTIIESFHLNNRLVLVF